MVSEPSDTGNGNASRWLTTSRASALLRVSPSTVRRWTEQRLVPAHRTAGGHRRYDRELIEKLAQTSRSAEGAPTALVLPPVHPVEWGVSEGQLQAEGWYARFSDPKTQGQMRSLGQRLLGLLIQHLSRHQEDPRFLQEAREVGTLYGLHSARQGASLQETIDAFLFFRRSFAQTSLQAPRLAASSDAEEIIHFAHVTDRFMDAVLSGIADGYESERFALLPSEDVVETRDQ